LTRAAEAGRVLAVLAAHAGQTPDRPALEGGDVFLGYRALQQAVDALAAELRASGARTVALATDNTPAWIIADLACLQAGIPLIPLPHFFSPAQTSHLLRRAGVDAVISDRADQLLSLLQQLSIEHQSPQSLASGLALITITTDDATLPAACAKITFTSGSTGEPKGVCLNQGVMETVASSLAGATAATSDDRHLALLPYATLLENIGGIYAPLLAGATIIAPGMAAVGMSGASGLDVGRFAAALHSYGATTCIMIPQMLHALVTELEQGAPRPQRLRYIAVGGAPVSVSLLQRAEALALPVFEGYGLSEVGSVVAVNRPGERRAGSVGKPLPHVQLRFAEDGEILVRGALFSGYLGDAPRAAGDYWPTGDIGYLDDDGFLHLSGRKKHIFITAFGRNVSPEWVERELSIEPAIAQCCVFGEARPFNVAVIVSRQSVDAMADEAVDDAVARAVDAANVRLPDYARISRWLLADAPFSVANGLWTGTGRPRRQHIFERYETEIDQLYEEQ